MKRFFRIAWPFLIVGAVIVFMALHGCASSVPTRVGESWDQENLKKHDVGCPTAVFITPGGNLEQCALQSEPQITHGEAGTTTLYPDGAPLTSEPKGFPSMIEAARAALAQIAMKPSSYYYEWGGGIAVNAKTGEFFYSPATTMKAGNTTRILSDPYLPEEYAVVATYHTHPCLYGLIVNFFSDGDLHNAVFGHEIVFMGDLCAGIMHEFVPGDKPDVEKVPHTDIWSSKGRLLGKFAEPRSVLVIE